MRGRALAWVEASNANLDVCRLDYEDFEARVKAVFDHPSHRNSASSRLRSLRQGDRLVADYSVDFWSLAVDAGWNEAAHQGVFVQGLLDHLKNELAARDKPGDLPSLVSLAVRMDNRIREHQRERSTRSSRASMASESAYLVPARRAETSSSPPDPSTTDEPMQLSRTWLTAKE